MSEDFPKHKTMKVSDLAPSARNARKHSPGQIDKIASSIKEFRFINPVVVDKDGGIIAGHGRVLAAKKLGMESVPVVLADHLTEKQRRAYMLADNRLAELAEWDMDMLKVELEEIGKDFDLDTIGFDDAWMTKAHMKGLTDEDEVPEPPKVPKSKPGDLWLLGDHRMMCGDSTSADDVKALLDGEKPHLMVTDPPYGVEYDANWRGEAKKSNGSPLSTGNNRAKGKVKNDDRSDWSEAWALFPGDVAYVWHADLHARLVQNSLENSGFKLRAQIIWAKNCLVIGRGDYHSKHEPCFYAVRKGKKGHWNGSRKETTVWDIDKPQKSETGHSTQKPVECMRRPIVNNSNPGDLIYDPFLGSGTTLIAAETEGRTCYGMELHPAYVDVIVKRWQDFSGQTALHAETGETFGG